MSEFVSHDNFNLERFETCTRCGEHKPNEVEERYSFGVYAGRLCLGCCKTYRDHCGVDQPQGSPCDLDEPYDEDDY